MNVMEWVVAVPLLIGVWFGLLGSVGLWRFGDFYMRLHAPTLTATLGIGGVVLASCLYFGLIQRQFAGHELMISLFLCLASPISSHLLAKTAIFMRHPSRAEIPQSLREAVEQTAAMDLN